MKGAARRSLTPPSPDRREMDETSILPQVRLPPDDADPAEHLRQAWSRVVDDRHRHRMQRTGQRCPRSQPLIALVSSRRLANTPAIVIRSQTLPPCRERR